MLYYPSGIRGDRGLSLDWAILSQETMGCHYFTGNQEMDSGDIWAEEFFTMRNVRKSSLYRNEVTQAAVKAVLSAVEKFCTKAIGQGRLITMIQKRVADQTLMTQNDRKINWAQDTTQDIVKTQFGRWSSGYFEYGLEKCVSLQRNFIWRICVRDGSLVLLSVGTKTVFCLPQAMERSGLLIYVKIFCPLQTSAAQVLQSNLPR